MSADAKIVIGRTIRALRESKGFSQEKLSARAGITYQYLSAIENGKENFSIGILEAIANALAIEVSRLVEMAYADPSPVRAVQDIFFVSQAPLPPRLSIPHIKSSLENILALLAATDRRVFFAASYRTQKALKEYGLRLTENVIMVDPIGYEEMLVLMTNSRGVITDSGTIVEETCVLQVPSLQIRKATERPQVYDVGSSVKFDPAEAWRYPYEVLYGKFEALYGRTWPNPLGDGHASERIAADLLLRLKEGSFRRHKPEDYHLDIRHSHREDGLLP